MQNTKLWQQITKYSIIVKKRRSLQTFSHKKSTVFCEVFLKEVFTCKPFSNLKLFYINRINNCFKNLYILCSIILYRSIKHTLNAIITVIANKNIHYIRYGQRCGDTDAQSFSMWDIFQPIEKDARPHHCFDGGG